MVKQGRIRRGPGSLYRKLKSLELLATRDRAGVARFLLDPTLRVWKDPQVLAMSQGMRVRLIADDVRIANAVRGYHALHEQLTLASAILRRTDRHDLTVVECGVGYGASTAKLSLAVRQAGGQLIAFDSFRGIPDNTEVHESLDHRRVVFRKGAFTGRIGAVRRVVERYGAPEVTTLVKGLFEDTLPAFRQGVDVAVLDVDLLESTRTCIRYLFRLLRPGGVLFSADAHLRATVDLLQDTGFWEDEVGFRQPPVKGLGRDKLVSMPRTGPIRGRFERACRSKLAVHR